MDDYSSSHRWGKFSDAAEAELPQYRALSGIAVVGFLLGLASAVSIIHVGLSFVGVLAAICCATALARISRAPSEMSGRRLAVAGLALAVFWTVAGSARHVTNRYLLDTQSRAFALQWFEYLKKGEPEKALEMSNSALARRPLDDKLLGHLLSSQADYEQLEEFVSKPEVRALLALGGRAQVRHYACVEAGEEFVSQVYAVTYDDRETKKSFLVKINLIRSEFPDQGVFGWQTGATDAPWTPGRSA